MSDIILYKFKTMINLVSLQDSYNPQLLSVKKIITHPASPEQQRLSPHTKAGRLFQESDSNKEDLSKTPLSEHLREIELQYRPTQTKEKVIHRQVADTPPLNSKSRKQKLKLYSGGTSHNRPIQLSIQREEPQKLSINFDGLKKEDYTKDCEEARSQFGASKVAIEEHNAQLFGDSKAFRVSLDYFEEGQARNSGFQKLSSSSKARIENNQTSYHLVLEEERALKEVGEGCQNNQKGLLTVDSLKVNQEQVVNAKYKKKIRLVKKYDSRVPFKEEYRYCLGCQSAVLQANIGFHSRNCQQYVQLAEKSINQIAAHVEKTLRSLEENVAQKLRQLKSEDLQLLKEHADKMASLSMSEDSRDSEEYAVELQFVQKISINWCLVFEELHKVDWFCRLRQNIKREYGI